MSMWKSKDSVVGERFDKDRCLGETEEESVEDFLASGPESASEEEESLSPEPKRRVIDSFEDRTEEYPLHLAGGPPEGYYQPGPRIIAQQRIKNEKTKIVSTYSNGDVEDYTFYRTTYRQNGKRIVKETTKTRRESPEAISDA